MPSEMLSGPDLGAGYLHQLTLDREGDRTTFTFHAQEGGADAAGPPKGPLDVFGWVHPSLPCQFGGPRCWHRRFLLPFSETPRVRMAYNRTRFVLETMIGQAYEGVVPAVESSLDEVVRRVSPVLAAEAIPWYVGGSAGAWLLGAPLTPRDLDIGTTRGGVDRVAELLREYLIEPAAPTDWPPSVIVHGARAFVGTFQTGARVEWGVPLGPDPGPPGAEFGGRPEEVSTLPASFHGVSLRVTRPEYSLVRAWERGGEDRVAPLLALVRRIGPDLELLSRQLARSRLSAEAREVRFQTVTG